MIKLSKEDKLIILTLVLVLGLILIFLSFEIVAKFKIVSETEIVETNFLDNLYNTISSLPKNEDPSKIRRILNEIFELINNKDYDKLYNLLADDFKKQVFPTIESFKEHIETNWGNKKYSPSFSSYEKFSNVYVLRVAFLPENINNSDITSKTVSSTSDTFSIHINEDGSYKFSFLGYIGSISPNTKKENDEISILLNKVHLYNSKTIFNLKISNNTNTDFIIEKERISCDVGFRSVYYPSTIWVPANSEQTINFTIYTGLSLSPSLPTEIYFSKILVGDTVYIVRIPITYPIKFY